MRSRGDVRRALEWLARAVLVGALALALVRSLTPAAATRSARRTDVRGLAATLAAVTRSPRIEALSVAIDSMPPAAERAWLAAVRRAGVRVGWSGRPSALAIAAERSREPEGRVRIVVVADSGAALALADSAGALDSIAAGTEGGMLLTSTAVGAVRAARGRMAASAHVPAARPPRAVLVLGRAGWEAKFVAAALQEAGWSVRARQVAAPGVVVADPALLPVDTARYAAVVVLDSTAADLAPAIARFAVQGGGLVLAGATPAMPTFASLAPAKTGTRRPGRVLLDADTVTLTDLPVHPLAAIRPDAVRLEGSAAAPVVAVRRAGLGRIATVGYDETWRWRMLGGTGGPASHQAWWSRTVASVAPDADDDTRGEADAAPVAALVEALGPAREERVDADGAVPERLLPFLLVAIVAALLAETTSRRFRGAR